MEEHISGVELRHLLRDAFKKLISAEVPGELAESFYCKALVSGIKHPCVGVRGVGRQDKKELGSEMGGVL